MIHGITDNLRRGIKSHRLAVEQCRGKRRRMVPLKPRRNIHQQRKRGGVAFRKTVFSKAANLRKALLGIFRGVTVAHHAIDKFAVKRLDAAMPLPCRHGAAQPIGLLGVNPAATIATRIACS